jgi:hypothetical protein
MFVSKFRYHRDLLVCTQICYTVHSETGQGIHLMGYITISSFIYPKCGPEWLRCIPYILSYYYTLNGTDRFIARVRGGVYHVFHLLKI